MMITILCDRSAIKNEQLKADILREAHMTRRRSMPKDVKTALLKEGDI